jgi:predicted HTH transcriptional regulator
MSQIPNADLQGFRKLRDRSVIALQRLAEDANTEFKESASWDYLKWKILRTSMAMANLRNGGIIIVGITERDGHPPLAGISPKHFETYDPDQINDVLAEYCSPSTRLEIAFLDYQEKRFLCIQVREFDLTPVVCRKNGPDGEKIKAGSIYVRPFSGRPRSTMPTDAEQLNDLLDLSAEKRARRLLTQAQGAGLQRSVGSDAYDEEIQGL